MALFNRRKRDVEPILAISVVVLLVASGAVVSLSIFGSYTDDEDLAVAPGREISVSYTGSLYDYYDEEGALIFDTNVKEHADNEDYSFIGGFDKTKKFDELHFTQGEGKVLASFENALIGHKAGDTVKVEIPLGEGYKSKNSERSDSFEVSKIESMSVKDFESIYDEYIPSGSHPIKIETIYGWDANVWFDTTQKMVKIEHKPVEGEEYVLTSNELNVHGSVNVLVEFDEDGDIVCKMVLDLINEDEDYMLWVETHSEGFYIYGESENEGFYKVTNQPAAEGTIYFVITIESVSKRAD